MPQRVFISYSHKDESEFQEFLGYLQNAIQDEDRIDIWSDQKIEPGDDWNLKIQAALDRAAVAVLLVSNDFLGSRYILEHELRAILERRLEDRLNIASLYLSPSAVADREIPVPVSGGAESRHVKLIQFQGLNKPDQTVDSLSPHERKKLYVHISRKIRDLVLRPDKEDVSPAMGDRAELAIHLQRRGRSLIRTYSIPNFDRFSTRDTDARKALEETDAWDPDAQWAPAGAMFELLFGDDEEQTSRVLVDAFDAPIETLPTPTWGPLRIRLQSNDPKLLTLPWHLLEWQGQSLKERDWTVELCPLDGAPGFPCFDNHQINLPRPVLLVIPDAGVGGAKHPGPDAAAHRRGLQDLFQTTWPKSVRGMAVAGTLEAVATTIRQHGPCVVYYYGAAEAVGGELSLVLNPNEDVMERVTLAELATWLAERNTAIVFLNLFECDLETAIRAARCLSSHVPVVAIQVSRANESLEARESALRWLEAVLTHETGADPV